MACSLHINLLCLFLNPSKEFYRITLILMCINWLLFKVWKFSESCMNPPSPPAPRCCMWDLWFSCIAASAKGSDASSGASRLILLARGNTCTDQSPLLSCGNLATDLMLCVFFLISFRIVWQDFCSYQVLPPCFVKASSRSHSIIVT